MEIFVYPKFFERRLAVNVNILFMVLTALIIYSTITISRLTNLITPILKLVDDRVLAINTAVELSYLLEEDQLLLHDLLLKENTMPSMAQAARLKEISRSGGLTQPEIQAVMTNHKGESRASNNDMFNRLRPYFPDATSADDMIKQIIACIG